MTQLTEMGYTLVPNEFAEMVWQSGLEHCVIGVVLGVKTDTIKSWDKGRRVAPPFALKKMQKLLDIVQMED
jgi:DNA-binding transcriptional regulator YiaG